MFDLNRLFRLVVMSQIDPSSSSSNSQGSAEHIPVSQAQLNSVLNQFQQHQNESMGRLEATVQQMMLAFQQQQHNQQQQQQHQQNQQQQPIHSSASSAVDPNPSRSLNSNPPPIIFPAAGAVSPQVKLAKPNFYTGALNANVDTWLFEVEQYLIGSGIISDAQRISLAASYLRDLASTWWYQKCQVEHTPPTLWTEFKETLKARFQPIAAARTARANLRNLRQGGKLVAEYCNAFYKQIQLISDMGEADKIDNFMNGLNANIANEVDRREPKSLQEAMTYAQATELRNRNIRHSSQYNYQNYNRDRNFPPQRAYESKTTTTATSASTPMELSNIDSNTSNQDEAILEQEYERYLDEGDMYESSELFEQGNELVDNNNNNNINLKSEVVEEQLQAAFAHRNRSKPFNQRDRTYVPNISYDEFIRLRREGKCLRCKKPGHIARNCPLLGQSRNPNQFNHSK